MYIWHGTFRFIFTLYTHHRTLSWNAIIQATQVPIDPHPNFALSCSLRRWRRTFFCILPVEVLACSSVSWNKLYGQYITHQLSNDFIPLRSREPDSHSKTRFKNEKQSYPGKRVLTCSCSSLNSCASLFAHFSAPAVADHAVFSKISHDVGSLTEQDVAHCSLAVLLVMTSNDCYFTNVGML